MEQVKDHDYSSKEVAMPGPIDYQDIPRKMKMEYSFPSTGRTYKVLDKLSGLLAQLRRPQVSLQELMTDAANIMVKHFSLKMAAIGLRGSDGIYRYEVLAGYRPDTEAATRKLEYTREQFSETSVYKGYMISKHTKVFLAEDNPWLESEREAYNLPSLLGMTRRSLDDYLEGDYINIHILGRNDDLLGWIELAGTTTGKLPDVTTIRWVEFIGQIIATLIVLQKR
jgi:hypothetical protein